MEKKRCKDCGGWYDAQWFTSKGSYTNLRRPYCKICWQTRRDKKKFLNRWIVKARDTLYHHVKSLGIAQDKLIDIFGWDISNMARDCKTAYEGVCAYCNTPFNEMEHGIAAITLDIVNVNKDPFYNVNTRWVCRSCNTQKQSWSPCKWGQYLQYAKEYKIQQDKIKKKPFSVLPLFDTN